MSFDFLSLFFRLFSWRTFPLLIFLCYISFLFDSFIVILMVVIIIKFGHQPFFPLTSLFDFKCVSKGSEKKLLVLGRKRKKWESWDQKTDTFLRRKKGHFWMMKYDGCLLLLSPHFRSPFPFIPLMMSERGREITYIPFCSPFRNYNKLII